MQDNFIFHKFFNDYEKNNEELSKLFVEKEFQLKSDADNRMKGYQTWNDLYNIFQFNHKSINWLGEELYDFIIENYPDLNNHYIHAWFNVLDINETLPWHTHSKRFGECEKDVTTLSGHYMVDTEPSFTIYKYDDGKEFKIKTKNGRCSIFNSDLRHKTDFRKKGLRISVAFDIVPKTNCTKGKVLYKISDLKLDDDWWKTNE